MRDGKIGAFGASNVDGAQLRDALAAASESRYEWVQNSYSLLDREVESEVLPLCAEEGLGFTPFSPLAGGWLTGKYERGAAAPAGSRMTMRPEPYAQFVDDDAVWRGLDGLAAVAAERGTSQAALALAWLLGDSAGDGRRRRPAAAGAPRACARGARASHHAGRAGRTRPLVPTLNGRYMLRRPQFVTIAATVNRRQQQPTRAERGIRSHERGQTRRRRALDGR